MPIGSRQPCRTRAAIAGILLLGACDAQPTGPPHGPPARIIILEGDQQLGTAGTVAPERLAVLVVDDGNRPVRNAVVNWCCAGVLSDRSSTNLYGVAYSALTFPTQAAVYTARASIEGRNDIAPAVFTLTSTPGLPSTVEGFDPDPPFGTPQSERTYYAVVMDEYRNTLPGVEIEWKLMSGGGTVQPDRSTTGEDHDRFPATATHRLGPDEGIETVVATASGAPGVPGFTFQTRVVTALTVVSTAGFQPDVVSIPAGRSVAWLWNDDPYGYCEFFGEGCIDHDVTFPDHASGLTSSPTQAFGGYYQTFHEPGTYHYHCTVHGTTGIVTVQ